ncbi:MAG TPA: class IV adenylate cyclase [Anaerolineaceae bacterium]|nr:class IV adenylate cyclase [Anaerolineaceae bacterium]
MNSNDQEIEVKFYVRDLAAVRVRLEALGAVLAAERVLEHNLRFDTPDGRLTQQGLVLRLRRDRRAVLTFKGPSRPDASVAERTEIEVEVGDFDAARRLLEALGYRVGVMYEKYRTTYRLGELEVVLDELPYGHFVEIEGPDADAIQAGAEQLGLDWEVRCVKSYLALFNHLVNRRLLDARNLTFAELKGVSVSAADLGLQPAD